MCKIKEQWKPIEGYEELYEVSNMGNVRSLDRTIIYSNGKKYFYKGQMLKPQITRGYLRVGLKNKKYFFIHRLVAEAFLPNPSNYKEINHKDENPKNNCVDNLEWCDRTYNINYGSRTEKATSSKQKPILQFDLNGEFIKKWDSIIDVERELGFKHSNISSYCLGKKKTAYGFIWKYA